MTRFLIINDEQKVLNFLFSDSSSEDCKVDFVDTLDAGVGMASTGRYDIVIIQGSPSSDFLDGKSIELFSSGIKKRIPADTVLFVTSFTGIRTSKDIKAFGASDFIISGTLLKTLLNVKVLETGDQKDRIEKEKLKNSLVRMANIFQSLIELENPFQKGNIESIVSCCRNIAVQLKIPQEVVDATEVAASLYDIGKIGIEKDLLWKKGALEVGQKGAMKNHPAVACELLKNVPFPWDILSIIKHHHERFNGTGYPDALKGRQIPVGSRIIAVVDAFHAMVSRRPYRDALSIDDALREINKNAGIQFDPEIVEVFLRMVPSFFKDKLQKSALKVLLVDYDINNLARLKMVLDLEGYEVATARNVDDAISLAGSCIPDLVVSELFTGKEEEGKLLEYVRGNPEMEDTPFIFLSAVNNSATRIAALKSGADDYVCKPYDIREFTLKLEILLKRSMKHKKMMPVEKKTGVFGSLKEFSLPDLLQILEYSLKTALVTVRNGDKEGSIYMEDGRIRFITQNGLAGEDALLEMFQWVDGTFSLEHGVITGMTNIHVDSAQLILQTFSRLDEIKHLSAS